MKIGQSLVGVNFVFNNGTQLRVLLTNEEAEIVMNDWHTGAANDVIRGDCLPYGSTPSSKWAVKLDSLSCIFTFPSNQMEGYQQPNQNLPLGGVAPGSSGLRGM